jgi:hypothetical protein
MILRRASICIIPWLNLNVFSGVVRNIRQDFVLISEVGVVAEFSGEETLRFLLWGLSDRRGIPSTFDILRFLFDILPCL